MFHRPLNYWCYREILHTLPQPLEPGYDRRQRRLHEVSHPAFYQTVFASPQLELIELDDTQWLKVQQRSLLRRTLQQTSSGEQLIFAGFEISALIVLCLQVAGW